MIKYTHLNEMEIAEADAVARGFRDRADKEKLRDIQQDKARSGVAINKSGLRGERAFAKMTGLEWLAAKRKYSKADFEIGGLTIDVKTSPDRGDARPIMFIVKEKEDRPCQIYVLIWERRESNLYSIMGWKYSDHVFVEKNLYTVKEVGDPCYRVWDLESPETLFKVLEERADYG